MYEETNGIALCGYSIFKRSINSLLSSKSFLTFDTDGLPFAEGNALIIWRNDLFKFITEISVKDFFVILVKHGLSELPVLKNGNLHVNCAIVSPRNYKLIFLSLVDIISLAGLDHHNYEELILNIGDNSVTTDTVTPQSTKFVL